MMKLEELKNMGFKITWKLLSIGFSDGKYFAGMLSSEAIIEYALSLLKDNNAADIIALASANLDDREDICKSLNNLAQSENSNYDIEYRKWKLIYVMRNMPKKDVEPIAGLIQLGDIWAYLDFPEDCPHTFQGKDNNLVPSEYYTLQNYNRLYDNHIKWIEGERFQINNSENNV